MCIDCFHRQKLWACFEQRCDMIWLTSRCGVWNILWDSKTGKARLVKRWWDRRIRNPLVTSLRMPSVQWPGQKPGKTDWTVSEPKCCLWCMFALTILRRVLLKETQKAMLQREGAMGSRETFRVRRKSVVAWSWEQSKKKQTLWWRRRRDSQKSSWARLWAWEQGAARVHEGAVALGQVWSACLPWWQEDEEGESVSRWKFVDVLLLTL